MFDELDDALIYAESLDRGAALDAVRTPETARDPFLFGLILERIRENPEWWRGEHESFQALLEHKLGVKYRKAMYLIDIAETLVDCETPIECVEGIGWTKLKELTPVLDADNVGQWLERAALHTTLELRELVRAEQEGNPGKAEPLTTLTFQVRPDQRENINKALETIMAASSTDSRAVALDLMATMALS